MNFTSTIRPIQAQWITAENFRPYGQMIEASEDGALYDAEDAQLQLDQGTPRFYIMRLQSRGRRFSRITRHVKCTQCLGSLGGQEWWLGVAAPTESACPSVEDIVVFRIPGTCFIKLNLGTWHAGPYFDQPSVDFYNLELADTNITDHETCDLLEAYGLTFEIDVADVA
ncbi:MULTISPECIES: ureidoglycolate lyase [unclassified Leptolyngbya]|uniref:ureidoglycolate lyase n=1 Tax=unclassified Leptolyngbya TaxID=2650499 RepID=UPI0016832281|nr:MULTISPECIES: ureidoglycolate lyase [unclassified Leptolyngbya]MBD1913872.1 Ureidoglycolate hydrolase [Leptolyngbya sp. FACHB-8]MBD2157382.1 Ureidoglycolate hydrolase [Leptolyngbya sp. FACHB-16]